MSQHIFKTLRQFVLSHALKALPLQPTELARPQPKRAPVKPESDLWLFDAPRSVDDHMADLGHAMQSVSGVLGNLHQLVSAISRSVPEVASLAEEAPAFGAVWSDAVLFDGEPQPYVDEMPLLAGEADFLFDDVETDEIEIHPVVAFYANGGEPGAMHASL